MNLRIEALAEVSYVIPEGRLDFRVIAGVQRDCSEEARQEQMQAAARRGYWRSWRGCWRCVR